MKQMSNEFVAVSRALSEVVRDIAYVARTSAKVLITGESGAGKDVAARLIHEQSGRKGPFITIHCAGVPESSLECDLFGTVRPGFARAYRDSRGGFDRAEGGTIFLDEIGEMSLRMQTLLLQYLETGNTRGIGSAPIQAADDVRIVAATNRNLYDLVVRGTFREDLYYRLNIIHIVVPSLRKRPDDILPLAEYFLDLFSTSYKLPRPTLSDQAVLDLMSYYWPGNVRELRNVVERIVVRNRAGVVSAMDMAAAGLGQLTQTPKAALQEAKGYHRLVSDAASRIRLGL